MPSIALKSPRRFIARSVFLAVVLSFAVGPIGASAAPVSEPTDPEHLEVVAEQYNLARVKVDRATAALERTDRRIDAAQARVAVVQTRTRARATALYLGSSAQSPMPTGDAHQLADLHRRSRYLDAAENPDRVMLATLASELHHLAVERTNQRDARELLQRNADDAQRLKRRLETLAAVALAQGLHPTGDAAGPISRTAAPNGATNPNRPPPPGATPTSTRPGTPPTAPPPTPPPTSPPTTPGPPPPPPVGNQPPVSPNAGAVVAYARAQLGKPYVFATSGPQTFDCSGLTMAAWASVGVRMPHYSGSQATMFPRVRYEQLQPGDIVAFYGDLHHVGLYIGGGMMIHAPQTGDVVKIAPAWRDTFQWGVRPH